MRKILWTVGAGFLLCFPALGAQAGGGCQSDPAGVAHHIFEKSDADSDGVLSPEEFASARLERYGTSFDDFDANGDGATSYEEYLDLFDKHHPPQTGLEI